MITEPVFLMLIGIPGSGKSSWLDSLEKTIRDGGRYVLFNGLPFTIVCPDSLRKLMGSGISDQSQNIAVWQAAKEKTIGCLEHGTNVILDATNVNAGYRKSFIVGLPPCRMLAKTFPITPEESWSRVKRDVAAEVDRANVPEEVIYRMYGEFLYTVKILPSEGFEVL